METSSEQRGSASNVDARTVGNRLGLMGKLCLTGGRAAVDSRGFGGGIGLASIYRSDAAFHPPAPDQDPGAAPQA
jgi:hypothetical protein